MKQKDFRFTQSQCPNSSWFIINNYCYFQKIVSNSESLTHPEAASYCAQMKSSLTVFKNDFEYVSLRNYWRANKLSAGLTAYQAFFLNVYSYDAMNFYWTDTGNLVNKSMYPSVFQFGKASGTDLFIACNMVDNDWNALNLLDRRQTLVCQTLRTDTPQPCYEFYRSYSYSTGHHRFTFDKKYSTQSPFSLEASSNYAFPYHVDGFTIAVYEMTVPTAYTKSVVAIGDDELNKLYKKYYRLKTALFYLPTVNVTGFETLMYELWYNDSTPTDSLITNELEKNTSTAFTLQQEVKVYKNDLHCMNLTYDCLYTAWSAWSACSFSCGIQKGTQYRNRTLLHIAIGRNCSDTNITISTQICNNFSCPINCSWNNWSPWSQCNTTCDGGYKWRNRTKLIVEQYNGACDGTSIGISQCNNFKCPINCSWNEWSQWNECNSSCDGYKWRQRTKYIFEEYNGTCTGNPNDIIKCNNTKPNCVNLTTLFTESGINDALADPMSVMTTLTENIPYTLSSMNKATKKELGFQMDDNIKTCSFNGEFCNMERDFETISNPSLGNCFTFNYPVNSFYKVDRAGQIHGLSLLLYSNQTDYICSTKNAGFKVYVHNSSVYPFIDNMGYDTAPGYVSSMLLRKVVTKKLGSPYGSCVSADTDSYSDYFFTGLYTTEGCLRSCYQRRVLNSCQCGDPRYPLPENETYCNISKKDCIDKLASCESTLSTSNCNCPASCIDYDYVPIITKSSLLHSAVILDYCELINMSGNSAFEECMRSAKNNFAILQVGFQTLRVTRYEELPCYQWTNFVADFSNVIGLLLGAGYITIIEIIFLLLSICFIACHKKFIE